jgi:hypothetical protein
MLYTPGIWVALGSLKEAINFPQEEADRLDVVPGKPPANAVES